MADKPYDIQEIVNQSGVPRRTIYFYVQQGILPSPQGAGLAAHYGEEHLLRLKLIPILRAQGMRLDEIRQRFERMDLAEMRQMLQTAPAPAAKPAPAPARSIHETGFPLIPSAPSGFSEQRYTHYSLPAGITLSAPENLSPLDRQRLNLLLQAARQIFTGGAYYAAKDGDLPPGGSGHPASGEEPDHA